ncbi:unnamed protein product [Phytophthora fragariaefolia]|uniref:Unnamed protein product n=1 Tax=Phytophthora fragariaefolia TaxID=1490495 RepID=A0A9W6YDH7_9STRA|nr:unnamed protein product [Phytophthora fragariaefolia]
MVERLECSRAAKHARRVIRALSKPATKSPPRKRYKRQGPLEEAEVKGAAERLNRHAETRKRNAAGQLQPVARKNRKPKVDREEGDDGSSRSADAKGELFMDRTHIHDANVCCVVRVPFFAAIDGPFLRICGSCGELAKSDHAVRKRYDPGSAFFAPLCNSSGQCEIISEAVIAENESDGPFVWLCRRCNQSLLGREVPKSCRASGYRIAPMPEELAVLNRMED